MHAYTRAICGERGDLHETVVRCQYLGLVLWVLFASFESRPSRPPWNDFKTCSLPMFLDECGASFQCTGGPGTHTRVHGIG